MASRAAVTSGAEVRPRRALASSEPRSITSPLPANSIARAATVWVLDELDGLPFSATTWNSVVISGSLCSVWWPSAELPGEPEAIQSGDSVGPGVWLGRGRSLGEVGGRS